MRAPRSAATSIAITEPANDCLVRLGLTAATTSGEAAGGAGVYSTLNQGTIMWFGPAWNFVWHVTTAPRSNPNGIRSFSEFKAGSDKVLTTTYTWQDSTIYAPQALQVVKELRVARPDQSIT